MRYVMEVVMYISNNISPITRLEAINMLVNNAFVGSGCVDLAFNQGGVLVELEASVPVNFDNRGIGIDVVTTDPSEPVRELIVEQAFPDGVIPLKARIAMRRGYVGDMPSIRVSDTNSLSISPELYNKFFQCRGKSGEDDADKVWFINRDEFLSAPSYAVSYAIDIFQPGSVIKVTSIQGFTGEIVNDPLSIIDKSQVVAGEVSENNNPTTQLCKPEVGPMVYVKRDVDLRRLNIGSLRWDLFLEHILVESGVVMPAYPTSMFMIVSMFNSRREGVDLEGDNPFSFLDKNRDKYRGLNRYTRLDIYLPTYNELINRVQLIHLVLI